MSELSVGALSGLAANSYVIDVASGSTLDVTNATGTLPAAQLPAGTILQTVNARTDTEVTTTSSSYQATGLAATITPSSASSKIFVMVHCTLKTGGGGRPLSLTVFRGSIASGTDLADNTHGLKRVFGNGGIVESSGNVNVLDDPSTTSATTYTVAFKEFDGAVTSRFSPNGMRAELTLMEVAG